MSEKAKFAKGAKKIDLRTFTMVAVLIILWIVFTFFTSNGFSDIGTSFLSVRNLSNLARQMAIVGIMGSSMVMIIVTGGIDLSAGCVAGFIGCIAAYLQVRLDMATGTVIVICLLLTLVIYFIQGVVIAYAEIVPFIVTLGGQLVFSGLILAVTKGATIAPLKESLKFFGGEYVSSSIGIVIVLLMIIIMLINELQRRKSKQKHGTVSESIQFMFMRWGFSSVLLLAAVLIMNSYRGVPVPVLILGTIVIVLSIIAERTTFGRSIYAIGGNIDAARYSGINVRKKLVIVYMIHGVAVSIAGLILAARLNASPTTAANMGLELDAIAAAVIGGTSMSGGVGKAMGAILGALIMASIDNGMSMLNMEAFWQYIVKGLILVGAVWFDIYSRKRSK